MRRRGSFRCSLSKIIRYVVFGAFFLFILNLMRMALNTQSQGIEPAIAQNLNVEESHHEESAKQPSEEMDDHEANEIEAAEEAAARMKRKQQNFRGKEDERSFPAIPKRMPSKLPTWVPPISRASPSQNRNAVGLFAVQDTIDPTVSSIQCRSSNELPAGIETCILTRVLIRKEGVIVIPVVKGQQQGRGPTYTKRVYLSYLDEGEDEADGEGGEEGNKDEERQGSSFFEIVVDGEVEYEPGVQCLEFETDALAYPNGILLRELVGMKNFQEMVKEKPVCISKLMAYKKLYRPAEVEKQVAGMPLQSNG